MTVQHNKENEAVERKGERKQHPLPSVAQTEPQSKSKENQLEASC